MDFDPDFATAADWARSYRAAGVQVVPAKCHLEVRANQTWKCPLLPSWSEFQNELVSDETFDRWYGPNGQYVFRPNMGTITGRCSGNLFVIDLDTYKSPAALSWWTGLMAVHNSGMVLETVEQVTGGGGSQKLFRAPASWTCPTNKTSIGIDIRGQGGFAMLSPSLHESGNVYHWVEGHSPAEMPIAIAPDWLLEAVERLVREHGGVSAGARGANGGDPAAAYDGFGHQTDGRETKMYRLIWAAILDWYRECPIKPSEQESLNKAIEKYEVYERDVNPQHTDETKSKRDLLEMEGRGQTEFWLKWAHTMKQWDTKVREKAGEPNPKLADNRARERDYTGEFEKAKADPKGLAYPFLDVGQIMDKPDPVWAVESLINEKSLAVIFGPPSSLKTFIALDYGLSTATRLPTWWGHKINRHGAVIYLCREGTVSFKFRIKAWELHRKTAARDAPFYLVEHPTNFMDKDDRIRVIATIEAVLIKAAVPVAAIIVDTVSRVLAGAKENLQEDMSLFVEACEAIQQRFECIVLGIHHTNKNGGIRGSTVIPGAGDTLIETRRETGALTGSIFVQKVKDGKDGYEVPFKVTKIDILGGIVPRDSLVIDGLVDGAEPSGDRYEGKSSDGLKRRDILQALHEAWEEKKPWGVREAVEIIMVRWRLKRAEAAQLLLDWRGYQVIEYVVYNTKTKAKGYRKCKDI